MTWKTIVPCVLAVGVAGCGGGGGGTSQPLASFSRLPANGTVTLQGETRTGSYTANLLTNQTTLTSLQSSTSDTATFTRSNDLTTAISINSNTAPISFNFQAGDVATQLGILVSAESANGQNVAVFVEPVTAGLEYQTFGAWLTGFNTGSGTVGVGSFGAPTPNISSVPVTNATYQGASTGFFRDAATGAASLATSAITANVNLTARTMTMSSSGTQLIDLATAAISPDAGLDFTASGTLNGVRIVGTAANVGNTLSGPVSGSLYGPSGEELGGTYSLSGSRGNLVASFGATR